MSFITLRPDKEENESPVSRERSKISLNLPPPKFDSLNESFPEDVEDKRECNMIKAEVEVKPDSNLYITGKILFICHACHYCVVVPRCAT